MVKLNINGPDVIPEVPDLLGRHPTQGSQVDLYAVGQVELAVPGDVLLTK